ncbi:hypothetical protein GALMADRAFT_1065130 [Galerina marginata CBS 339.88]|uniref:Aminoglycoside phosphotransferase domain-containing protein n=1 Tax=Galerina marginata (strain CBS 339.88) TaxID=685588 RepID=A0A067SJE3_GALM3|nr:hypothetical protein GALMADRAFT_1065130 [Galerina marginata CBS 339.88]
MPNTEPLTDSESLEAGRLAAVAYHHIPLVKFEPHEHQGMGNSYTFVAKYGDDTEAIIQLRDRPIDIAIVHLARTLLGDIVPNLVSLKATKTSYAYGQPKIPGDRWDPMTYLTVEDDTAVSVQFANILARCRLHLGSGTVVDDYVIPCMNSIINAVSAENEPFNYMPKDLVNAYLKRLTALRDRANHLRLLDLMLCHTDPNPFNVSHIFPSPLPLAQPLTPFILYQVIIDESFSPPKIVGLIDWEEAKFLPFGMNSSEIRMIAVLNIGGYDQVSEAAKSVAVAFWNTLVAGITDDHKSIVLDSMEIGYVIRYLDGFDGLEVSRAKREVEVYIERMNWFEETFRPLCLVSSLDGTKADPQ